MIVVPIDELTPNSFDVMRDLHAGIRTRLLARVSFPDGLIKRYGVIVRTRNAEAAAVDLVVAIRAGTATEVPPGQPFPKIGDGTECAECDIERIVFEGG